MIPSAAMRIAFLVPDLRGRNGWSRYALDLARTYRKAGHDVLAIVATESRDPEIEETQLLAPALRYLEFPWLASLHALRVRRALKYWKPDIVHATAEPYAMLLPWLGRRAKGFCVTMHGTYAVSPFEGKPSTRRRMVEAYRITDLVFAVSRFTKGYVKGRHADLYAQLDFERKIVITPNAVDCAGIPPPDYARARGNPARILGVGAVKERKGYLHAIDACAALKARGTVDFRYDIIGPMEDRAYADRLNARIHEHGLTDVVRLLGEVSEEELKQAYATADLFLLLSVHAGPHVEGFGLVFLEASARGIPVIGPDTGGCPEAIADGRSGFACPPMDTGTIADRMEDILVRSAISRGECRAWAEEHDIRPAADRLLEHYASLL